MHGVHGTYFGGTQHTHVCTSREHYGTHQDARDSVHSAGHGGGGGGGVQKTGEAF